MPKLLSPVWRLWFGTSVVGVLSACHSTHPQGPAANGPVMATGAYWGVVSGLKQADGSVSHVIGVKDVGPELSSSRLDFIEVDGSHAPLTLTPDGPTADPLSVQVSLGAPEAVLFLDSISPATGLGTLMYADLSTPVPFARAVAAGTKVPGGGAFFGADGKQVLFFADFDLSSNTAHVYWSDGTGDPVDVGPAGDLASVVLSRDRRFAFLGVNADPLSGTGDLIRVEFASGLVVPIATGVVLRAVAYARVDSRLQGSPDLAFSVTPDGRHAVFATPDESVHLWSEGGETTTITSTGRFPALTDDAQRVAYYDTLNLNVWIAGNRPLQVPAAGALAPLFSADGRFVAYLGSYNQRGSNGLYGTALGEVFVLDTAVPVTPPSWGSNAAWHSVAFETASNGTAVLSLLSNCHDVGGVPTLDGAIADFVGGNPTLAPPQPLARAIDPFLVGLPGSGGWSFMASDAPFTGSQAYSLSLWRPGDRAASVLSSQVVHGSLQTGAQIPSLGGTPDAHADEILFLTKGTDPSFGSRGNVLWGAVPGQAPFKIREHVVTSALARDGRVIVVTAESEQSSDLTVRVVPFAKE